MLSVFLAMSAMVPAREWGVETLQLIRENYYLPQERLYADEFKDGKTGHQVSFNWGTGVMLPALIAAAAAETKYIPWLREYADACHRYWSAAPPVGGFAVLPGSNERYYDDNEWMVMALADASVVLKDPKYLTWAEDALLFVLSGLDKKLGGGIYWREQKDSKNTCSNGPGAAACLAIYRLNKKSIYLQRAKQIYDWTSKTFQDPDDHLFWDSVNLDGKIDKTKWSYNTALMIRSGAELYSITKEDRYRKDVETWVASSRKHWVRSNGAIHDGGRFAHLLMESWGYAEAAGIPFDSADPSGLTKAVSRALEYVHEHCRSTKKFYGGEWFKAPGAEVHRFELIDQAAAARGYWIAAQKQTIR